VTVEKTPWVQLVVGEHVRGRGGLVWTIAALERDPDTPRITVTLERRHAEGAPTDRATVAVKTTDRIEVVPLTDDPDTAATILTVHTSPAGDWTAFPGAHAYSTATMLAHLKIVHGINVTDVTSPFTRHITAHGTGEAARPHQHGTEKAKSA
jgi:hypothetical protein